MKKIIHTYYLQYKQLVKIGGYSILLVTIVLTGLVFSLTQPFLSIFAVEVVGMTPTQLGIYMSLTAIFGVIISTLIAKVSDGKVTRKLIIIIVSLAGVIGYTIFAFSRHYVVLLVSAISFLAVVSSGFPQLFALARETVVNEGSTEKELAISNLRMFFSLAWVVGPVIGALILRGMGYQGLFLIAALIYLTIIVLLALYPKQRQLGPIKVTTSSSSSTPHVSNFSLKIITVSFVLLMTSSSISMINTPLFIIDTLSEENSTVGILFSISAALEIPFMILLGLKTTLSNKSNILLLGTLTYSIYFLGLFLSNYIWQILILQLFGAFSTAVIMANGMIYFQDLLPDKPGTATTLFSNTNKLGGMLAGFITGTVADFLNYRSVFIACLIMTTISGMLIFFVSKIQKKKVS
ncbi:sugar efflux transporter [Alkalihalobacillus clausii]|uniref:sugar efflux transporter n=1 Tax=Shouchella clausii TaxID=79880 RepID=UPI000BA4FC7E|nr:sugar efflux transporter [Shouchella clausii]MCM3549817.1 sugar efflux transporter [Shouchella clausii]PAF15007.1 hypothetical protein CHH59_06665 [Shouchella clausii]